MDEMENMHFSTPHIQNLFDDGTQRYYWVISLSRVVETDESGRITAWGIAGRHGLQRYLADDDAD